MSSNTEKFRENAYRLKRVDLSTIHISPRRILKGIRRLHRQPQSSIQLNSATLFRNPLPSTETEKCSILNKSRAHRKKITEIKIGNSKQKVDSNEKICNILYLETLLFNKFFSAHSNIFEVKSSSKTLKKVVEIHKGKRFVRMECMSECNIDNIPELYFSKECMNDVDSEYSKKNVFVESRHPSSSKFLSQDKLALREKGLISPNLTESSGKFFSAHSNIFEVKYSSKILKKVVEIHKGKRFVRMEYVSECNLDSIPELYFSKECKNDGDSEYSKKNVIGESRHPSTRKFISQDKLALSEQGLISPNLPENSCIFNSENRFKFNHQLPSLTENTLFLKFISNSTVFPNKMSQECLVLKNELVSFSSLDVTNEKVEICDKSNVEDGHGTNFNHNILQTEICESPQNVSKTAFKSLYDEMQNRNKILDSLEKTTDLFIKELSYHDADATDCVSLPVPYLEIDFDGRDLFNLKAESAFEKKGLRISINSFGTQYSDFEINKLDKSLGSQIPTFIEDESYESLKNLATIDESNEENDTLLDNQKHALNEETYLVPSTKQSDSVDFQCKLSKFRKESEENKKLNMPSKSTLLVLDSILEGLQITYEVVEREVHSWLLNSEADQSYSCNHKDTLNDETPIVSSFKQSLLLLDSILFRLQNSYQTVEKEVQSWLLNYGLDRKDSKVQHFGSDRSCEPVTVRSITDEHGCFTKSNYIMRFKGTNTDTTVGKWYEQGWSSSDSDVLSLPEGDELESDLDGSESSLEGSFKQFRTDSRASTFSSGSDSSDDSDDTPRFSLPSHKSNEQKLYAKRTELCAEVSSRKWSWKNAETEISFKCTHKRRRFRSEEHHMQGSLESSKDFWQGDLGIPKDLLRDFNLMALESENTTDVECDTDVEKC